MESQYDIFIGHNNRDDVIARTIHDRLARIILGNRNPSIFLDDTSIDFGENFVLKVEQALAKSKIFIVLLSPNSVSAPWVRLEYSVMLTLDKAGSGGRIIPILVADCEVPPLLSVFKWCDLRGISKRYNKQLELLATRVEARLKADKDGKEQQPQVTVLEHAIARSDPAFPGPDARNEELISNLVHVTSMPERIWCATLLDGYELFTKKLNKENRAPFIHRENRIWSFTDLSASGVFLRGLVDHGTAEDFSVGEIEATPGRDKYVTQLLNQSVKSHCLQRALAYDLRSGRYYFRPGRDGTEGRRSWMVGRRRYSRKVAFPIYRPDGTVKNWIHLACGIRFLESGSGYVLKLDPGYVFTWDGRKVVSGKVVGPWSTKLKSNEYNRQVFTHLRFWLSWMLTDTAKDIFEFVLPPDDVPIHLETDFITMDVFGGIEGDYRVREELSVPMKDEEWPELEDVLPEPEEEALEEELELVGDVSLEERLEQEFDTLEQQDS